MRLSSRTSGEVSLDKASMGGDRVQAMPSGFSMASRLGTSSPNTSDSAVTMATISTKDSGWL